MASSESGTEYLLCGRAGVSSRAAGWKGHPSYWDVGLVALELLRQSVCTLQAGMELHV